MTVQSTNSLPAAPGDVKAIDGCRKARRSAHIRMTRKASSSVVMISLEDYEALEETSYLLRSPKNVRRLVEAIAELEAGGGTERKLVE